MLIYLFVTKSNEIGIKIMLIPLQRLSGLFKETARQYLNIYIMTRIDMFAFNQIVYAYFDGIFVGGGCVGLNFVLVVVFLVARLGACS